MPAQILSVVYGYVQVRNYAINCIAIDIIASEEVL